MDIRHKICHIYYKNADFESIFSQKDSLYCCCMCAKFHQPARSSSLFLAFCLQFFWDNLLWMTSFDARPSMKDTNHRNKHRWTQRRTEWTFQLEFTMAYRDKVVFFCPLSFCPHRLLPSFFLGSNSNPMLFCPNRAAGVSPSTPAPPTSQASNFADLWLKKRVVGRWRLMTHAWSHIALTKGKMKSFWSVP